MFTKSVISLSLFALCLAEPPTNYLPPSPTSGYSYPTPSKPFIPSGPSPPPSGPPAYRPPPSGPSYDDSSSNYRPAYGENDHLNMPHIPGMPYDFNYAVKDDYYGTDYSHNAISDGDVVKGEYRVQLPDGRLQIVRYTADWKTGFHADVQYEGEAKYPEASNGYPAANKPPGPSYGPPTSTGY